MGLFSRGIGPPELILILFIVLLLFGSTRLPKLASSMGKAIREFRKSANVEEAPSENGRRRRRTKTPPTDT